MHNVGGKSLKVDVSARIRRFYASANAILVVRNMSVSDHVSVYASHLCYQF